MALPKPDIARVSLGARHDPFQGVVLRAFSYGNKQNEGEKQHPQARNRGGLATSVSTCGSRLPPEKINRVIKFDILSCRIGQEIRDRFGDPGTRGNPADTIPAVNLDLPVLAQ